MKGPQGDSIHPRQGLDGSTLLFLPNAAVVIVVVVIVIVIVVVSIRIIGKEDEGLELGLETGLHLFSGTLGKGQCENLFVPWLLMQQLDNATGQDAGLASPRSRHHPHNGGHGMSDRLSLRLIQTQPTPIQTITITIILRTIIIGTTR
eukprot:scaffold67762_cov49-Attheya_sp.AAC.2